MIYTRIRTDSYYDSIQLTLLTRAVNTTQGVKKGLVMMGTSANKTLFEEAGLYDEKVQKAKPNDMVVAIEAEDDTVIERVMAEVEVVLRKIARDKKSKGAQTIYARTRPASKEYKSRYFAFSLPKRRKMGEVHSIFARSFNVKVEGQLLNFSTEGMSLSAYGCLLAHQTMDEVIHYSRPGDLVRVTEEAVTIYTAQQIFKIELAQLKEMDLSIPTLTLPRAKITKTGMFGALQALPFQREIGLEPTGKTKEAFSILEKLPHHSKETIQQTVRYLIGRGKGLTPSGDDVLIGYTMIRKAFHGVDDFEDMLQQNLRVRSTTDISQAFYGALFNGFVSSLFVQLIAAVETATLKEATDLTNRIVHYGHTSGYDTLFGFYLGLQSLRLEEEASG